MKKEKSLTINYFSLAHIMYIALALGFVLLLWFLLRKKDVKIQRATVLVLMLLNVIQHLFKMNIYPQYGGGFSALCTAYNMCATLILISPIAYFSKSAILRDFVFYVGSAAGIVAILVPYWHIGMSAFTWDVYRFFICHALLFASSLLPLLFRHHKPSWRCFWRIGLCFFAAICLIIVNDIVFIALGIYQPFTFEKLYEGLVSANPCWSFGPPEAFSFLKDMAKIFSPDVFVGANPSGHIVPILWYFIPVYLGITLLAFPVCTLVDKKNFLSDMQKLKAQLKSLKTKLSKKKQETEKSNEN